MPPPPAYAPTGLHPAGAAFLAWLRAPRPEAALGIWRFGHHPRPDKEPETVPGRQLVVGALLALVLAWFFWSLLYDGYLGLWWLVPMELVFPDSWVHGRAGPVTTVLVYYGYFAVVAGALLVTAGRFGRWPEVWRRYIGPHLKRAPAELPPPPPGEDPAEWPQLRAAGAGAAADRLAADARGGLLRDVDYARISYAWELVRSGRHRPEAFVKAVLADGAAAWTHPSGARDLPARTAHHDLLARQVRIGTVVDDPKTPYAYRGAGLGISPHLLGSSLLAVGPSGAGKSGRVVRPLAEALCLQALAGQAAVVVVGGAGDHLGPAAQYDVVVRIGAPDSAHDLDLYGGTTDPDEAAAVLAEALAGDLASDPSGGDGRRAAVVLAQLLGPYRAVHGRFPSVPELRQLLEGAPAAIGELRRALERTGQAAMLRDLDARGRQSGGAGDPGVVLADRIALLDRPVFADFFAIGAGRAVSLRSIAQHPLRVRIELPERHEDACRVIARLVLAQFAAAARESGRRHFAALVLDDATGAVTAESVRQVQRLRAANAGVVLCLRSLADVPDALHGPLYGAVGCHMALSGINTWDGSRFARAWGTHWVEMRDVAQHTVYADKPHTRALHAVRKLVTGKAVTTEAVTVRQVEREHWSASELAHAVPAGHAVIALSSVTGERSTPLLVDLRT
ncbi:ATP-binding protein [Streptomyces griseofuscus]